MDSLPCDLPCPKCGSSDIHRRYHCAGDTWNGADRRELREEHKLFVQSALTGVQAKVDTT